jgi:predicted DNA-binding transcriptional regulator AlpA
MLKTRAVADRFGVNPRTIRRWAEAGAIPRPLVIGRTPLWEGAAIEAFIRQRGMGIYAGDSTSPVDKSPPKGSDQ